MKAALVPRQEHIRQKNGLAINVDLGAANFDGVDGHKSATGATETPSVTYSTTINRQALLGFVARR